MTLCISVIDWNELDLERSAAFILSAKRAAGLNLPDRSMEVIRNELKEIWNPKAAILAHSADEWFGWLAACEDEFNHLLLNPGKLGGHPIIKPGTDREVISREMIRKVLIWAGENGYAGIQVIVPLLEEGEDFHQEETFYHSLGFDTLLRYVDMVLQLSDVKIQKTELPDGLQSLPLDQAGEEELLDLYLTTFAEGDARFYFTQSEEEKKAYFKTLGLSAALAEPGSGILRDRSRLVGFLYALPYGESNLHISCMCVHPEYQSKGLGGFLLNRVIEKAQISGCQTITLGTETEMRAYQLYKTSGFQTQQGSRIFTWRPKRC